APRPAPITAPATPPMIAHIVPPETAPVSAPSSIPPIMDSFAESLLPSPPQEIAASSVAFNSRIACLLPWHCAAPLRPGGWFLAPAPTLPPTRGRVKGVNPVHRVRARGGKRSQPELCPVAGPATGRCETGGWPHLPPNRW